MSTWGSRYIDSLSHLWILENGEEKSSKGNWKKKENENITCHRVEIYYIILS
ncbi:Uncharacterized protein TCM_002121 [Theobroma cacao]|uniref:Uncharacterized protein n=1 Tax=Theobroma cacao TaxID=3641 RepID=A0A061DLH6_THECC|nr:Uncharacterized protein TCM_002121 [Theobroma cacao]